MRKTIILLLAAAILGAAPQTPPEEPELSARCAVLMGPEGQILYERNAHERCLIASTTKLMTALVAWEHSDPEDAVEVPAACCGIEGSSLYLTPGQQCTVGELMTGMLLASGNDAAAALARHCAGSEESFAAWMNEKARALGMSDSHFCNPHGLNAENHYGSAADLARLMAACMEVPELAEILRKSSATVCGQALANHNKLLWRCPGCLGGKTGYTQAAGRCLVSCCEREGTRLYCVTLNAPDDWNDQIALYDWGFARYETRSVTETLRYRVPLINGESDCIELRADPLLLFLPRDAALSLQVELPRFVFAPVREGECCGRVRVLREGAELGCAALRFARSDGAAANSGRENHDPETAENHRGVRPDGPAESGGGHRLRPSLRQRPDCPAGRQR